MNWGVSLPTFHSLLLLPSGRWGRRALGIGLMCGNLIKAISFPLPLAVPCYTCLPFPPLLASLRSAILSLVALLSPDIHPPPHWCDRGPTLSDSFRGLKPGPGAQPTRCPDDAGSKIIWDVHKLLPDYTAQQPKRQPNSLLIINLDLFCNMTYAPKNPTLSCVGPTKMSRILLCVQ
jgi:hypothetical protein